jgi:hypothetical protein
MTMPPRVMVQELEKAFERLVAEYHFAIQTQDVELAVRDYMALSSIGEIPDGKSLKVN